MKVIRVFQVGILHVGTYLFLYGRLVVRFYRRDSVYALLKKEKQFLHYR